jgi:uncharacterized protein Yka (UPF0111/DUF47 family)
METSKEIKQLRKAFKIEYENFREKFNSMQKDLIMITTSLNSMSLRLYELSKQADLMLSCIEKVNEAEQEIDKISA